MDSQSSMKSPSTRRPASTVRFPVAVPATGLPDHRYDGRRWVYTHFSGRTRGLSVGINLTPGSECDYRCRYCAVPRISFKEPESVDGGLLAREFEETLAAIRSGAVFRSPPYLRIPGELRTLGRVLLSGEGEPTLCPNFAEIIEMLIQIRALGGHPFFRLVLETNGSGLERAQVVEGLGHFTSRDEVWVKLDAGNAERFHRINGVDMPFDRVLSRILGLGRRRPVVIHSLFDNLDGHAPSRTDISDYLRCLIDLRAGGALISRVQIQSASHLPADSRGAHLPLGILSDIARQVRREVGIDAEVF
jgi:wyosine [tRNA(Phe)-imidazoG37] synthetase (radical SAM superfamily)